MMTPEGRVKAKVDKVLSQSPECMCSKPVVAGYGVSFLDYVGCSKGRYFEIETKAKGERPTPRQAERARKVEEAGGRAFVIIGETDPELIVLANWLDAAVRVTRDGLIQTLPTAGRTF